MEVTVMTLNFWGIPGISKDRKERLHALVEVLLHGEYDFVLLQELWSASDYDLIRNKCATVFPFGHYFYSGVIGAGIAILSRWRIVDTFFHPWSVNGYMHKIHHGDWWGGKGVGACTVDKDGYRINLYVAHLHAEYNRDNDEYCAHRLVQAFDTSQYLRFTRRCADVSILGADLNIEPGSLPYEVLVHNAGLEDSFLISGKPPGDGMTSETVTNSYTPPARLLERSDGTRIDYIMYSCSRRVKVTLLDCWKPLPALVPGKTFSYSDHEAVCNRLRIEKLEQEVGDPPHRQRTVHCLNEAGEVCDRALRELNRNQAHYGLLFAGVVVLAFGILPDAAGLQPLLVLVASYLVVMATFWSRMERNGILSARNAIGARLSALRF